MNWTSVATFNGRDRAEPLCRRLTEAGLHPEIHDGLHLEKLWFVNKPQCFVRLDVPANEFERGEQLLIDLQDQGVNCDAIQCPECHSFRVQYPQFAKKSNLTNVFLGLAAEFHLIEKSFYCEDCHLTWAKPDQKPAPHRDHMAPDYFIDPPVSNQPASR
jgi:hypothetical protein